MRSRLSIDPIDPDLSLFVECAKAKSFLGVSEKLGLQQSSVTKRIRALEDKINHKLFHRSNRGVKCTEFGEDLLKKIEMTNQYWKSFADSQATSLQTMEVSVACHQSVGMTRLPGFLPAISEIYPNIDWKLFLLPSLKATEMTTRLECDFALVVNPVRNAELVSKRIATEHVALWGKSKDLDLPTLLNPDLLAREKVKSRVKAHRFIEIRDYEVIATLVATGKYIGILPNPVAERHGLTKISSDLMTVQLCLITHKDRLNHPIKGKVFNDILNLLKKQGPMSTNA